MDGIAGLQEGAELLTERHGRGAAMWMHSWRALEKTELQIGDLEYVAGYLE